MKENKVQLFSQSGFFSFNKMIYDSICFENFLWWLIFKILP